jgi:hypothetical protein
MAASALSVQPQDAHAHDVTGANARHTPANLRQLTEEFTNFSRARKGLGQELKELTRGPEQPRFQLMDFNSSEGWGSARLMGARKWYAQPQ